MSKIDINIAKFCRECGYSRGVVNHSMYNDRMDLTLLRHLADRMGADYHKYLLGENDYEKVFEELSTSDKLKAMPSEVLCKLQMQIAMELYNREFATASMKRRRYEKQIHRKSKDL